MHKNFKIFLVSCIAFVLLSVGLKAQQAVQLTQNIFNTYYLNPGYAGHLNGIDVTATFRDQWAGFGKIKLDKDPDDPYFEYNNQMADSAKSLSPRYVMLSASMPIRFLHGGVGIIFSSDQIGLFNNNTVHLGYAFQYGFTNGSKLGVGLQLKLDNIVLRVNELIWGVEGDPIYSQMLSEGNDLMVDLNAGVFFRKPNSIFFGVSAFNLFESHGNKTLYKFKRSFNAFTGYEFAFPASPDIKIIPSALVKTDLVTFQVDVNTMISYKNKLFAGVNYRLNDAIGIMVGLAYYDFRLTYAYDIGISKMNLGGSMGSHEVVFNYFFNLDKDNSKITQRNTRYL